MTPEFRDVPGFPLYYASDDGRVFSTRPWRGSMEPRELAIRVKLQVPPGGFELHVPPGGFEPPT